MGYVCNELHLELEYQIPSEGDTYSRFLGRYCEVNRVDRGGVFSFEVIGLKNIDELKEIISPVFLQRKNVAGLKPIVRTLIPVEVNTSQYRTVMLDYYKKKNSHLIKTLTDKISYYNKAKQILAIEKVPFTISRIEESVEAGGKILMFSFYRDVVSTIKDHFDKSAVMLMGGMAEKDIQSSIDSFQNDPSKKVFVGQINAAGSAITLTAANRVIFNDLDWVPANLLQAEGRANRKGQTSTVFSEYIIAANTFDEKLAAGKLHCTVYQRSCDMFLGVPFNIASYALLTHLVAEEVGLKASTLSWMGGDCHIYKNHLDQVKSQLRRTPYDPPTLKFNKEINDIFSVTPDDIEINGYRHHGAIKAPIAV